MEVFMTQTYKSPVNYKTVTESDTFEESENVGSSEVVLLSYANDNYYLNLPQKLNPETAEYDEGSIVFQHWQDYKDIDFNGWFMVEYDDENDKVFLKHFNTGKYMTIINRPGVNDSTVLKEEKSKEAELKFKSVNVKEPNIEKFTKNVVFKIRSSCGDEMENFISIADDEDMYELNGKGTEGIIENSAKDTLPLVVKEP